MFFWINFINLSQFYLKYSQMTGINEIVLYMRVSIYSSSLTIKNKYL